MWSVHYCSVLRCEPPLPIAASRSNATKPMLSKCKGNLAVEDDIEEGAVHVQSVVRIAIVTNKAQFAELIHEETDARACRADHLREHFLTEPWRKGEHDRQS
ncbi:MAG: hypothetical protein WD425_05730 [Nitrospirales bacterium]